MFLRSVIDFARQNIIFMVAVTCFFICISYVFAVSSDHFNSLVPVDENGQENAVRSINTYVVAVLTMAVSGCLLIAISFGSLINISRLNRKANHSYRIYKSQIQAVECLKDGVAILDENGIYTYMNKSHAFYYGYENVQDLIGKSWHHLYTDEKRIMFEKTVFPILRQRGWWQGTSFGKKRNGAEFAQEVSLSVLDNGGMICVVRDISEEMKSQGLLKLIKLAVEAADDGIAIADSDNNLVFMNRSFLSLHGYDPYHREVYLGTDWRNLYNKRGQEQINALVLPTTILKGSWSGTIPVMRRDGTLFYSDASLTKLPDGLILGVMRDVSERKQAEIEQEFLREKLFHAQKTEAIARLSDGIATDFNDILSMISQNAGQVRNVAKEEGEIVRLNEEILQACMKARELVDQLHAFSRNKNTRTGLIDLEQTLEKINHEIVPQLPEYIEMVIDIRLHDAYTHANLTQIEQIIRNICQNAQESIRHKGKIAITLKESDRNISGLQKYIVVENLPDKTEASRIRLRQRNQKYFLMAGYLLKGRSYLQLSIADNGQGISPDILPNIFDPFFTTKMSGKDAAPGLGLSTVHGAVIGMNGAIIVETVVNEGTTMHLFFPRTDVIEYRNREQMKEAG
jgi:PAS domain S-box-containing protein